MANVRLVSPLTFGLILILFVMPFMTFSCGGMVNVPLSGTDLAFGTTLEMDNKKQEISAEPLAGLALACAFFGLLVTMRGAGSERPIAVVLGLAGAVFLLLLKSKIDKEILKEGRGIVSVAYEFPFWAALVLFGVASAATAYTLRVATEKDPDQTANQ